MLGTIKKVKESYGFILIEGERQVFFHISDWLHKLPPQVGDEVQFDLTPSRKPGFEDRASSVKRIGAISSALVGGAQ